MMALNTDTEAVHQAVIHLLQSKDFKTLVKELEVMVREFDPAKPGSAVFKGDAAALNVLIELGVHDYSAFERVMDLVHDYRKRRNGVDRAEYQREIMRERRGREYKALELNELKSGKALKGAERKQFIVEINQRWARAQAECLAAKGALSWDERNEVKRQFWAEIDETLEANIEEATRVNLAASKPIPRRDPRRLD
jgi:hypothetical protein